eukprot:jgi/Ulvmu1/4811/UM020_0096.1
MRAVGTSFSRRSLRDRALKRNAVVGTLGLKQSPRCCRTYAAEGESDISEIHQLPIFPLGMVALPHQDVQLQIFEARYRVLFHTLLAGGDRIVEDLVQEDSPFKGTKRFGLCLLTPDGLSTYGTVLEILHHKVFPDARLLTVSKGRERFRLVKIVQERPVLLCDVEYLEDDANEDDLSPSAEELKSLFRDVLKLNARYKNMPVDEEFLAPPELEKLPPSQVAFWVGSMFSGDPEGQQSLLQTQSPQARIDMVKATLSEALKHTSAALAIESVFSAPSADAEDKAQDPDSPIRATGDTGDAGGADSGDQKKS